MTNPSASTEFAGRKDAHEEDECLFCVVAPHPNCEKYETLSALDPSNIPLGEDDADHLVDVPVCLEHYQAFEQYQSGRNIEEIEV